MQKWPWAKGICRWKKQPSSVWIILLQNTNLSHSQRQAQEGVVQSFLVQIQRSKVGRHSKTWLPSSNFLVSCQVKLLKGKSVWTNQKRGQPSRSRVSRVTPAGENRPLLWTIETTVSSLSYSCESSSLTLFWFSLLPWWPLTSNVAKIYFHFIKILFSNI